VSSAKKFAVKTDKIKYGFFKINGKTEHGFTRISQMNTDKKKLLFPTIEISGNNIFRKLIAPSFNCGNISKHKKARRISAGFDFVYHKSIVISFL